jgi:hypothetical protein
MRNILFIFVKILSSERTRENVNKENCGMIFERKQMCKKAKKNLKLKFIFCFFNCFNGNLKKI